MSLSPFEPPPAFEAVEIHRAGFGLLPSPGDRHPGAAIYLDAFSGSPGSYRSCSCGASKKKTCRHVHALSRLVAELRTSLGNRDWDSVFVESLWYRLGELLYRGGSQPWTSVKVKKASGRDLHALLSESGDELLQWQADGPSALRFLARIGRAPGSEDRTGLLEKLALMQRTPEEHRFNAAGLRSHRQSVEESLWGRLAYHCFREYGDRGVTYHPAVNESTGAFTLACRTTQGESILKLRVPAREVRGVLGLLAREFPEQTDLAIHPIPLRSIFKVSAATELDLEVRPMIQALQASGEARYFQTEDFKKFCYGDLVYVKELGLMAELERPGRERKFLAPASMTLKRSQLASFVDEHRQAIEEGSIVLAEGVTQLPVLKDYDHIEIAAEALERSWYWLSIRYGFGSQSVSLNEVLRAKREGLTHLETPAGWIDLSSPAFKNLGALLKRVHSLDGEQIRLGAADVLRLASTVEKPVRLEGECDRAAIIKRLMDHEPSEPFRSALRTPLREYQTLGATWLRFLWEHRLGGLLCDDMGLGKTHQAMALMASLKTGRRKIPFLVVSPTTVISHWRNKLREHAPGLNLAVYHGGQRRVKDALRDADVLLTSYGILRNDVEELAKIRFSLVVFDEIQHLKNRETLSYRAASRLDATVRLGLTGTPIENSLRDMKSLFDLVLPGYLGSDEDFGEAAGHAGSLEALRKTIAPFVLRRLKSAVLDELPEKIEDLRTCSLSEEQVKLYRDAIESKADALVARLRSPADPPPYIHVFALLSLLKQICDHPALVGGRIDDYEKHASGKWDLFQELLFECLDSGQKVVVFSQYLGMIAIMEKLLSSLEVEFVTLTGATRDRGEIVRRFNEDKDCRVFLGSLKAGGTGIDLVGGTVVIHYDRWWNAAREDQATDRVHRIGQKRAVQIFKLVTEGTLEEKIARIIERKRGLMNAVVEARDPRLGQIFSREEMIELLQPL